MVKPYYTDGQRVIYCGDCLDVLPELSPKTFDLLIADPPYGMGKEKQGVKNDNLYRDKLDRFQMKWWTAARGSLKDNASAYIWGNAEDLWRLWWVGGLRDSERLTFRNEIVWDKGDAGAGGISHQGAAGLRLYPNATERCLFFMLGEQGFGNNSPNHWNGWDSVRLYLKSERDRIGWTDAICKRLVGHKETSGQHWFYKSQWTLPTKQVYMIWQKEAQGKAFTRSYDDLKAELDTTRAHFNNTHENMTDVWRYPRVKGKERYNHPTPKPVEMMKRMIKSSCPENGAVLDPFMGTGPILVAGKHLGRNCVGIDIEEKYCEIAAKRLAEESKHGEQLTIFDEDSSK